MASFDRTIPPGGVGKITISVHTEGYQGNFRKSARVHGNDPKKKQITLTLMAFVKVPIYLSPPYVYFIGKEDESVTRTVQIKAGLDKPLVLTPDKFNLTGKLDYQLEQIEEGRRFMIRLTSHPGPPQTYQGFLRLKTNYPEKPMINIEIAGITATEEQPPMDTNVIPPPGGGPREPVMDPNIPSPQREEPLEPEPPPIEPLPRGTEQPVVDPNVTPPPGEEPLKPVVDPNVPPPPGEERLKPEPSLEPDADSTFPSGTEEQPNPEQPNQSNDPRAIQQDL